MSVPTRSCWRRRPGSSTAAAGIHVHTEVEGERRPLPAPIDAAAFRIVQEALTNVVRHARATTATVRIGYGAHDLTVEIDDNGDAAGKAGRKVNRNDPSVN